MAPVLVLVLAEATATVLVDNQPACCTARTCRPVGRCRIRPRSLRLGTELGNALRRGGNPEPCCGTTGTWPLRLLNPTEILYVLTAVTN